MAYSFYEPQETIWRTTGAIFAYLKNNLRLVWASIKYYIPYLLIFIALALSHQFFAETLEMKVLGFFLLVLGLLGKACIMPFLAITWHRIVLQGPDNFRFANPLRPHKSEWKFMGFGALLFMTLTILAAAVTGLPLFVKDYVSTGGVVLLMLIGVSFVFYFGVRASLVFPSIAVEGAHSFREVFQLSKGFFWKIILTIFLSMICFMLIMLVLMIPFFIIMMIVSAFLVHLPFFGILAMTLSAIVQILSESMGTIIGVMVLSNYYAVITQK